MYYGKIGTKSKSNNITPNIVCIPKLNSLSKAN